LEVCPLTTIERWGRFHSPAGSFVSGDLDDSLNRGQDLVAKVEGQAAAMTLENRESMRDVHHGLFTRR
jgi:hypothetical protein